MNPTNPKKVLQFAHPKNSSLVKMPETFPDTLTWWMEQYFHIEVTTSPRSQKEQYRDITRFILFVKLETGTEDRKEWLPRLSKAFQEHLRSAITEDGKRMWSDRTINRVIAHLKTFAKWIHKWKPFPAGNPMEKFKSLPIGTGLEIERALTPTERRKMLDFSDTILEIGGRSEDRLRYKNKEPKDRPVRKGYRPYRNRAIIYTLIETGMRRGAVCQINKEDVDFRSKKIAVVEKGGLIHSYKISKDGLCAIRDYLENERKDDNKKWKSPALFLPTSISPNANGRITAWTINKIWNKIAEKAEVKGKTPHSARHAMGRHIIEKTGNIAAVQRQLGHKNAAYSMQYARISDVELEKVLDERE